MSPRTVWAFNFTGWVLFTVSRRCSFCWGTWRAGDVIGVLASLAFLIACIAFIIPVWLHRPSKFDGLNP
jgi:integral membrane sensor domain MASE1